MFGKRSVDVDWDQMGRNDPYYAVCTDENYRGAQLDTAARERFLHTGEDHVVWVFRTIRDKLRPDFRPHRALDFGCGVGRLVIPMARECSQVVGVDVSAGMLAEARKNCLGLSLSNAEFVPSDDGLSQVRGSFDFIHSFIVFQHIPARRGLQLTRALLNRLEVGGVGALHYTYARQASPARKTVHWLRKNVAGVNGLVNVLQRQPFHQAMMQMNPYDLNQVCLLLQENGCTDLKLHFTDHGSHLGVFFFFLKDVGGR